MAMELHRPYIRKSVRQAVEENARRNKKGQFLDANTGEPCVGKYDLGHKMGHEFWREKARAEAEGLTQAQFNDRMNDPALYQIELPANNRSHTYEAKPSCAERAYGSQGVFLDDLGRENNTYCGHDTFQNGVIPRGQDTTIYFAAWDDNPKGTGYFTDQATVDSCTHGGVLNANELGDRIQTAKSNRNGDYEARSHCVAYDVDWNRLDEVKTENPKLYQALTNPDGRSPENDGIKCAYGKAEANTQHGTGGGNQYKIDGDTFQQAVDTGVFRKNPDKSFGEDKGNLERTPEPATNRKNKQLEKAQQSVADAEKEKPVKTSDQINADQVREDPKKPYLAQPDPAYGYGEAQTVQQGKPETAQKNPKAEKDRESNDQDHAGTASGGSKKDEAQKNMETKAPEPKETSEHPNRIPNRAADNQKENTGHNTSPAARKAENTGKAEEEETADQKRTESRNKMPSRSADNRKENTGHNTDPAPGKMENTKKTEEEASADSKRTENKKKMSSKASDSEKDASGSSAARETEKKMPHTAQGSEPKKEQDSSGSQKKDSGADTRKNKDHGR